jgi:GR25 family glycosyltransferase involved in LPS biosynthesis
LVSYNIISIDDKRLSYKNHIRETITYPEVSIPAINGSEIDIQAELSSRGLKVTPGVFSVGEIGIWLSMYDCWQWAAGNNEILITLEDDAIPRHYFDEAVDLFLKEVPDDWDFMCLWVPDNQKQDYMYNVKFDIDGIAHIKGYAQTSLFDFEGGHFLSRVYNGYGNVAMMFNPKGAKFLMDRVAETGLYTPVDCFMYQQAQSGRCNGYGPKPIHATLVDYDWAETTVHNTERYV